MLKQVWRWCMACCVAIGTVTIGQAQEEHAGPTLQWTRTFGNNSTDANTVVCQVGLGSWVGGYAYNPKTKLTESKIFEVNAKGQRIWETTFPDKYSNEVTHLIESKKGGVIAVLKSSISKKEKAIRVVKLVQKTTGAAPSAEWKTDIVFKESIEAESVVENEAGEIIISYQKTYEPNKDDYWINLGMSKIDPKGTILWSEHEKLDYDIYILDMLPKGNDEFILLSNVTRKVDGKNLDYYRFQTVNESGKIIDTQDLTWIDANKISVESFAIDKKGNIALVGDNARADDYEPLILMLDNQYKKKWQLKWDLDLLPKSASQAVFDKHDDLIVVGKVENWINTLGVEGREDDPDYNMWVAKISNDGNVLWEEEYGGTWEDKAISVAINIQNAIIVVGETKYSQNGDSDISVMELMDIPKQSTVAPKVWAVIVGVSDYDDATFGRKIDLRFCDDDAQIMYDFMRSPQGGSLPDEQIKLLINENATKENILNSVKTIFTQASQQDLIIFYFSGHGSDKNEIVVHNGLLPHNDVKNIINSSQAGKRLCLVDACHSGSWDSPNAVGSHKSMSDEEMGNLFYQQLSRVSDGIALFMSSSADETSLELPGIGHGLFTHFYIEGLKGAADKNSNRIVTVSELFNYVYESVRSKSLEIGHLQTPQLNGLFDHDMPVGVCK